MARYKCPCCGMPYNGKRCRECYYETFTEEIAHGNHVHEGEPLVVRGTKPIIVPRPTVRKQAGCDPYPGRKKKKNSPLAWVVALVIILASVLPEMGDALRVEDISPDIPDFFESQPVSSVSPDQETIPDGTVLYDEHDVRIVAEWQDGQAYDERIPIWFQNDSDQELAVYTDALYVNGYAMESSSFYCRADAGTTACDLLWLDSSELADAGIETISEIMFRLYIYDTETYETYGEGEMTTLHCAVHDGFVQQVDDSGQALYDQNGIRVIYQGTQGEDCGEAYLKFYVENNGSQPAEVYIGQAYVNDREAEMYLWCSLDPGTRGVSYVWLYYLPDMGIDKVEQIDTLELILEGFLDDEQGTWFQTGRLTVNLE